jgi:DNA modification methylase
MTTVSQPCSKSTSVPLALWPVAQTSAQYQRADRYLPECSEHPAKMIPALARRIVEEFSEPGGLVVDPMCGIGTTLVEATALSRRAVGVEYEHRWVDTAAANLDHMFAVIQRRRVSVRAGDARHLPELLGRRSGTVDLICTSPPYACDAGVIDKSAWHSGRRMCRDGSFNCSTDRANLGHARGRAYEAAMAEIYAGCFEVLRPGGTLVTVTKNSRRRGRTFDLAGRTVALCHGAGFGYTQHIVALHAAIRDSELVARPSFWQLTHTRRARQQGEPAHLVVHEDVCVFVKPQNVSGSEKLKCTQDEPKRSESLPRSADARVRSESKGSDS